MPRIQGDDYDRLAWDTWRKLEEATEAGIRLTLEAASLRGELASEERRASFRATARLIRAATWEHKCDVIRAFCVRHGEPIPPHVPLAAVRFGRDESMFPWVAWGAEAEVLGLPCR